MTGVVGGTGRQRSPPGLGVGESCLRIQRIKPMIGDGSMAGGGTHRGRGLVF